MIRNTPDATWQDRKWITQASAHGNTNAANLKPALEKKLPPEQLAQAQKAAQAAIARPGQ